VSAFDELKELVAAAEADATAFYTIGNNIVNDIVI
jgi:hypothetical protein